MKVTISWTNPEGKPLFQKIFRCINPGSSITIQPPYPQADGEDDTPTLRDLLNQAIQENITAMKIEIDNDD